jgi:hypothetical protein
MFFLLSFMYFFSTKLEKNKAEQIFPLRWGWGEGRGSPNNVYSYKKMQKQ